MDDTLRALGEILLKAVPPFFLVLLLYAYLTLVFFRPLEKVLQKRYEANEGARKLAEEAVARAAAKMAEYEAAMRAARGEIYQEVGKLRGQFAAGPNAALEARWQHAE